MLTKDERTRFQTELHDLMDRYGLVEFDRVACLAVNFVSACKSNEMDPLETIVKTVIADVLPDLRVD